MRAPWQEVRVHSRGAPLGRVREAPPHRGRLVRDERGQRYAMAFGEREEVVDRPLGRPLDVGREAERGLLVEIRADRRRFCHRSSVPPRRMLPHTSRMRRSLLFTVLIATLVAPSAYAAEPPEDPQDSDLPVTMNCVTPLEIPYVQNVMESKWSPDSTKLALVWFAKVPSKRSNTGYEEQEITDTLDLATGRLRPVGVGDEPRWSATGRFLSYWGPNADDLRVVGNDRIVALLSPTIPEVKWVGDGLIFIEKDQIREWREGAVRTIAKLDAEFVPKYPADDIYWSADGIRFTLTRYSRDGSLERFVGTTSDGQVLPLDLPEARYAEWSPAGETLLVRYLDRVELRDWLTNTVRTLPLSAVAGPVHQWTADGRTLLAGRVTPTVPAGNGYDTFRVWDQKGGAAAASLP